MALQTTFDAWFPPGRVAGSQGDLGVQATALAFLDLRVADGHVERSL